jgi:glycopeptide antibiotics resistance protein
MRPSQADSRQLLARRWSNRTLIVAVAGILFLTLYPFRFSFHTKLPENASPFLLGRAGKSGTPLDIFLNVLLFVPFGFGLCAKLRDRERSSRSALVTVWIAGALLSYAIEFAQIYIPLRNSGWEDVFTNSTGSLVGGCLFLLVGSRLLCFLSRSETTLEGWLSPRYTVLVFGLYFGFWLLLSIQLQQQTGLGNWDPACFLVIGNDATGRHPWKGKLSRLQIWDRPVSDQHAKTLTVGAEVNSIEAGLVTDLPFSTPPPYLNRMNLLPPLIWTPSSPLHTATDEAILDGISWITSNAPVPKLVRDLQRTKQFSVRVVLTPTETDSSDSRIVSISPSSGLADLALWQEGANLVFWFRSPLSMKRPPLYWYIPGVFAAQRLQDILFSYDGSELSLFLDGMRDSRTYRLTPGTRLAQLLGRVRLKELQAYSDVYYACVFLPLGFLLGIAARRTVSPASWSLVIVSFFSPFILELALVRVCGRPASIENLALSFFLLLAGCLWMNADSGYQKADSCFLTAET